MHNFMIVGYGSKKTKKGFLKWLIFQMGLLIFGSLCL
jgi:hypothetical protein